ncbi:imidazole glycerol phosphate synthase subunit HisH [Candidatus Tachikawaea gelatinosa]|uniref:Imidazole glycerol phosphate synthase subunit HisH n=1 Tax=Candidatus Tachikawaea gelatinosa TaxID=1410383 RepID=A0A090AM22_9ENTR|nr:imidazole glycerol phosphate synthase subunit HisH [Candidatus Tachikawaea gelatinosa]BAP58704.1 imidazole glycerol phosphate synthase subunit HisH [Candidatus Tachikawaea gelatinosa]
MKIVIINTGCANIFSLKIAIKRLGYQPIITNNKKIIEQSDKIFLPGVGTSKSAMSFLNKKKIVKLIKNYDRPVLGICLGMQLLGKNSEESPGILNLNIIEESSKLINTKKLPLPHMGWNKIKILKENNLFYDVDQESYFYFLHSYAMSINENTISSVFYDGYFSAAIQKNNFFGVQFHPERSGKAGEKLLKNFLEII